MRIILRQALQHWDTGQSQLWAQAFMFSLLLVYHTSKNTQAKGQYQNGRIGMSVKVFIAHTAGYLQNILNQQLRISSLNSVHIMKVQEFKANENTGKKTAENYIQYNTISAIIN